jgi:hypothetical protein
MQNSLPDAKLLFATAVENRYKKAKTMETIGMYSLLRCLTTFILAILASSVLAATQVILEIEVVDKGNSTKHKEIITFDDKQARFDFLPAGQKTTANTPYMLTVDGGKNWIIGDSHKDKPSCAQVDLVEFFQKVGGTLTNLDALVNPKISTPKITKLLEQDGPKMLRFPTKHVRVQITADAKASFLFKKYEYAIKITDDIWYATNLKCIRSENNGSRQSHNLAIHCWIKFITTGPNRSKVPCSDRIPSLM